MFVLFVCLCTAAQVDYAEHVMHTLHLQNQTHFKAYLTHQLLVRDLMVVAGPAELSDIRRQSRVRHSSHRKWLQARLAETELSNFYLCRVPSVLSVVAEDLTSDGAFS